MARTKQTARRSSLNHRAIELLRRATKELEARSHSQQRQDLQKQLQTQHGAQQKRQTRAPRRRTTGMSDNSLPSLTSDSGITDSEVDMATGRTDPLRAVNRYRRGSSIPEASIETKEAAPYSPLDNLATEDIVARLIPPSNESVHEAHLLSHTATASALWSRYYQHGSLEDLEEAIRLDRESLELAFAREHRAVGNTVIRKRTGRMRGREHKGGNEREASDTEQVIEHCEVQANLGVSLLDLFTHTRHPETLAESISLLEAAASTMSGRSSSASTPESESSTTHRAYPRVLSNLGNAYRERALLYSNSTITDPHGDGDLDKTHADFDRAIAAHEEALRLTPAAHSEWDLELLQNGLARNLMARGAPGDIERALDLMSLRRRALGQYPSQNNAASLQHRQHWQQPQEQLSKIDSADLIGGFRFHPPLRWSHGYHADANLPVPDLTNLIMRLTSFPSGCGGFADIYMGSWNKTRRQKQKVAIKVLRYHATSGKDTSVNERINKMLRAEIRIWHALDHPNVVKLLGTCRGFSPHTSMVLPWFANGSLSTFLNRHKSLIYSERLRLIREMAEGLGYLHSNAIIHGDLTGANVLITDDLSACLSDFGLSTLARDFDLSASSSAFSCSSSFSSIMGGSVRWAAPELFAFDSTNGSSNSSNANANAGPGLTLQTDVYSFGSVALQTFTGDVPYASVQNEMEVLLRYVVRGMPPERPLRLGTAGADEGAGGVISDVHWDILQSCWSLDPHTRPSSKALATIFV